MICDKRNERYINDKALTFPSPMSASHVLPMSRADAVLSSKTIWGLHAKAQLIAISVS